MELSPLKLIRKFCNPDKLFRITLKFILGFSPTNIDIYFLAFRHRSLTNYGDDGLPMNNERLEFLGDAILDTVTAEYLYHQFPDRDEGFLTKMRSKIVSRENLSIIAVKTGVDKLVISNITNGNDKSRIYGDAFEAFIGAIFIDKGFKKTKQFIINKIIGEHIDLMKLETVDTNFKSTLLEWVQQEKKDMNFITTEETSSDKTIFFVSSVQINNVIYGKGVGKTKKEAEQNAAEVALKNIHHGSLNS